MRVPQKYFSVAELAWTYSFAESTIRGWMVQGLFGPPELFLRVGNDVRVPTTGAAFFELTHLQGKSEERERANLVKGRTLGEARRRLEGKLAA